jgi:hypothetical protein
MLSCDYQDLVDPKEKKREQANKFVGTVTIDGVDVDPKRSFREMYASISEPEIVIPVWITYQWILFRARDPTAKLTVSDWPAGKEPTSTYGQEQTFNFLELQPYHE